MLHTSHSCICGLYELNKHSEVIMNGLPFKRELLNDEEGTSAWAMEAEKEEMPVCGGGDRGIMCGEAGCVHCGFTSATSPSIVSRLLSTVQLFRWYLPGPIIQGRVLQRKWPECFTVALNGGRERCWGCSSERGGENLWVDLFLLRECPPTVSRNHPQHDTFSAAFLSFSWHSNPL